MDDASPTPQLRFLTLAKSEYVPRTGANLVVLGYDDWDDWFEFETTHTVHVFDGAGQQFKIGGVKIGEAGQKGRRPTLPREFSKLDEKFFSVGLTEDFYKALADLGLSEQVLVGLNDLAYNLDIFERYKDERVATVSLFRTVDSDRIINKFNRLAHGNAELTDYAFEYVLDEEFSSDDGAVITFDVRPNSKPPSNVHTLIGRNGVGKTTLLNNIVRSYVDSLKTHAGTTGSLPSRLRISSDDAGGSFANLVSVTFSAFDPFFTESTQTKGRYSYIGLKESLSDAKKAAIEGTNFDFRIKNPEDLTSDFIDSAQICLDHPKRRRWTQALEDLAADPIFEESEIIELSSSFASIEDWRDEASRVFRRLSSGHKIVLLTITRLVELVEERSLVLLDEPESHLHPPLLSAFIRALSSLLSAQNGVAIVATHSPVVLQETPKSCAWILDRSGNTARARRPVQETFGENVALLTHEVFGLEVTETGFYELLRKEVARVGNYDAIMAELEGQLGTEAIAIVRALLPKEKVRVR